MKHNQTSFQLLDLTFRKVVPGGVGEGKRTPVLWAGERWAKSTRGPKNVHSPGLETQFHVKGFLPRNVGKGRDKDVCPPGCSRWRETRHAGTVRDSRLIQTGHAALIDASEILLTETVLIYHHKKHLACKTIIR